MEPYRNDRALTKEEIQHILNDPKKYLKEQQDEGEIPGESQENSQCQQKKNTLLY